jgi:ribosomal protein L11 methyltransferase
LTQSAKRWHAIDVVATAAAREAIEYGLMEMGATGTETAEAGNGHVKVTGYFDNLPQPELVRAGATDALRIYECAPDALVEFKNREVADRDWLAEWKKHWQPVTVGRFTIAPTWIESVPLPSAGGSNGGPLLIRIDPGMAFGTGTHETTRLCLKMIEKHFRGGSFLDVGTGTGILAIAAALMHQDARIEACDTDEQAIEIARENAGLNKIVSEITFRVGTIEEQTPSADLVCANLTAPVIVEMLPSLLGVTCGRLILSGILDSQVEMVQSRLGELGASTLETDEDGEWVAIVI